jgi:hypothetical protein
VKFTIGDEMRDRIIGALDTGCRRGEMLKIQNRQVDVRSSGRMRTSSVRQQLVPTWPA